MNKKKIINDPVYGFVAIPSDLIYDLIEHPYFQRLRRIKQLGLSSWVYPGALHTRFQHVIGAMSLTVQAVDVLRNKGIIITDAEKEAVCAAVLLHDMGHGPYSHTLEQVIIPNVHHEAISLAFMHVLNKTFNGKLDMAIAIFTNTYPKRFLHQLVSSQLDMDRLDYLRRDSFYTGVQEGVIGHDRIINMLNVHNDEMVIDEKGIYSIEKFLIARRLMYWQVYLHKTVIAAESLLVKIMERAVWLANQRTPLFATPAFEAFLTKRPNANAFASDPQWLTLYSELDDYDVFTAVKVWSNHQDLILSQLCKQLVNRDLPKIEISSAPFDDQHITEIRLKVAAKYGISLSDAQYLVYSESVMNKAYSPEGFNIKVLYRTGAVSDITEASDQYNISALAKPVTKYFLCYPKNV
ncbi:MAG: HD domain-containing protein [Bacteroidia bacterium]|nr:HD domain-containing protein [Bacteroidia bacterium]